MQKRSRLLILMGAVLLVAFLSFAYFRSPASEQVEVRRGNIEEAVYGLGKVKSNKVFELKIGVASTLTKVFTREGEQVKSGQKLVFFSEGSTFFAPFDGTVTLLPFHEKENAFPQVPILRIEDLNDVYLEVTLEQQGALRVRGGQPVKLSFESITGTTVSGIVESVFPRDDQFVVRIRSERLPKGVLPGMTADVAIQVGKKANVLLVPLAAITNGRLILSSGGAQKKVDVKVGVVDGDWAEVLGDDMRIGDRVLVPKR